MKMAKRYMSLDIGDKRVGVAVSDPSNKFALPCPVFFRSKFFEDLQYLADLAKEKGADVIVCGIPCNADGTDSMQTVKTRSFIEHLQQFTDAEIVGEDERYTSLAAHNDLAFAGVKAKNRKGKVDSIAACYILESFLAKLNKAKPQ